MTEEITKQLEMLGKLAVEGKAKNASYITERTHLLASKSQVLLEEIESLKGKMEDTQTSKLFNMYNIQQEILNMEIKDSIEEQKRTSESSTRLKQSIMEAEEKLKRPMQLLELAVENEIEISLSNEDQASKEQKLNISKVYTNSIRKDVDDIRNMISEWKLDIQENNANSMLLEGALINKNSDLAEIQNKLESIEYKPLSPEEQETNKLLLKEKEETLSNIKGETEFLLMDPQLIFSKAKMSIENNADKEVVEEFLNQLQLLAFEDQNFINRINDMEAVIATKIELEAEIQKTKELIKSKNYYDKRAANKDKKEKKVLEALIKNETSKELEKAIQLEDLEKRKEIISQTTADYQQMATMYEEDRSKLLNQLSDPELSGRLTFDERDTIYKKLSSIDNTLKLGLIDRLTFAFEYNEINKEIESVKSEQKILIETNMTHQNNLQNINHRIEKNTYINTKAKNKDKNHLKDLKDRLVNIEEKGTNLALSAEIIKQQIMNSYVPKKEIVREVLKDEQRTIEKPEWRARQQSESLFEYRNWKSEYHRALVGYYKEIIAQAKQNPKDEQILDSDKNPELGNDFNPANTPVGDLGQKPEISPEIGNDFNPANTPVGDLGQKPEINPELGNDFNPANTPVEDAPVKPFGKRVITAVKNIPKKIWEIISLKKVRDNIRMKLLTMIENDKIKDQFAYGEEEKNLLNEAMEDIKNQNNEPILTPEIEEIPVLGLNEIYNTIKEIVVDEAAPQEVNEAEILRNFNAQLQNSTKPGEDMETSYNKLKQNINEEQIFIRIDTDYVASDEVDPDMNRIIGTTNDRPSQFAVITKKLYDTVMDKYAVDLNVSNDLNIDSTPKNM